MMAGGVSQEYEDCRWADGKASYASRGQLKIERETMGNM
jgi:hypothetical protein